MRSWRQPTRVGPSKMEKKLDKEGSWGWILTKNWWTQIVGDPFVLSLWVSMLRDLLSGDTTFKKFCHFIKITFTLFHFCPGNYVGRRENKQYRCYWNINFVERKCGDEIFLWNFKALQKFILVDKIHFLRESAIVRDKFDANLELQICFYMKYKLP